MELSLWPVDLLHLGIHERSGAALASSSNWHEQPVPVTKWLWMGIGPSGWTARWLEWWEWLTRSPHSRWVLEQEEQSQKRCWFGVWPWAAVASADAAQRWGAVEHPKAGNREECASGRLACAQCAQIGDAESVSQQEFSTPTGHGPRLAERAQMMLHAAMKTEWTAVRSKLIAHLDCRFRRGACDAHAEEECGDSRTWRV